MTDKHEKRTSDKSNDSKYFDVSFDEPTTNRRVHHNDSQDKIPGRSKRWDDFYERFQKEQQELYGEDESIKLPKPPKDIERSKPSTKVESNDETKSQLLIDRSLKRAARLFEQADQMNDKEQVSNIKARKGKNLQERSQQVSAPLRRATSSDKTTKDNIDVRPGNYRLESHLMDKSNSKQKPRLFEKLRKSVTSQSPDVENLDQVIEPQALKQTRPTTMKQDYLKSERPKTKDEGTSQSEVATSVTLQKNYSDAETQSTNHDRAKNQAGNLPSPQELAKERERRRKMRIAQLEQMSSDQEIEASYQSHQDWQNQNHQPIERVEDAQTSEPNDTPVTMADFLISKKIEGPSQTDNKRTEKVVDDHPTPDKTKMDSDENQLTDDHEQITLSKNLENKKESDEDLATRLADESNVANASIDEELVLDSSGLIESKPDLDRPIVENYQLDDDYSTTNDMTEATDSKIDAADKSTPSAIANMSAFINDRFSRFKRSKDDGTPQPEYDKEKADVYSLKNFSWKDKTFFGINVTFNVLKRLLTYVVILLCLGGAMAGGIGAGYFANLVGNTPPPTEQEMREAINRLEQQSTLYYANGDLIADVRTDVVRSIANLDGISQDIVDGLIATEDEYFMEHPGVVPKAVFRAVIETLLTGSGTGGSTITQQLVKQQLLSNDVTFFRKANEILLALRLENYFSKDEILTAYLNVSPFGRNNKGENIAGIAAAAQGVFGVSPADVTLNQAAFLIGLPQDPYSYTPYDQSGQLRSAESLQYGVERMKEVLFRMYRDEKISKEEYETAIAYDITQDFLPQEDRPVERQTYLYQAIMNGAIEKLMLLNIKDDGYAWQQVYSDVDWYNEYYFAAQEQLRTGGYKVYSTIDKAIYDQMNASAVTNEGGLGAVYDGIYTDPETGEETYYVEKVQTGMVALDNASGRVLGFVSGTDFENNQIDHAFGMRRSPGSTIKPLAVYGPAVDNNIINPSTVIPDTSFVQSFEDGTTWQPTNYGGVVSDSFMTARTALLRSDNLPAVRIYQSLQEQGINVMDYLEKMGFNTVDSYTEADTQNLAFALGGVTTGPTVFEETRAFTTFANNGKYVEGYYIERIEDAFGNVVFQQNTQPQEVFSEDTNYLMVDMLRDTLTEGTGRTANELMAVSSDWIAKSGISEDSKDVWFIASTPSITLGTWIGYDSRYQSYVIDINDGYDRESVRIQRFWANVVNDLYSIRPDIFGEGQTFAQPASVQEQVVLDQTGTLPGSFTYNGATYSLNGPTKTELFKVSNPAPALTFDFMLGASEDELARFWNSIRSAQEEQRRQEEAARQQQSSQQSSGAGQNESNGDETTQNPDENNTSTPEETPTNQ